MASPRVDGSVDAYIRNVTPADADPAVGFHCPEDNETVPEEVFRRSSEEGELDVIVPGLSR